MRALLWLLVLTMGRQAVWGQVLRDDFSDNNLSANPVWSLDLASFSNRNGKLYSDLPSAGTARIQLSDVRNLNAADVEWRLDVQHTLSALSSANQVRWHLVSTFGLTNSLSQGYIVQLGNNQNTHTVELIRRIGGFEVLMLSSATNLTVNQARISIRVRRFTDGRWQLAVDPSGGTNYTNTQETYDNTLSTSQFTGLELKTDASGRLAFTFDNLYVGPHETIVDNMPPTLANWAWPKADSLLLQFSEALDASRLTSTCYQFAGYTGTIAVDALPSRPDQVRIRTDPALPDGVDHTFSISGLRDLAGNGMNDTTLTVLWLDVRAPQVGDLVLNELMADPSPPVLLPEVEYIELHNRNPKPLRLHGLRLQRGTSNTVTLPTDTIAANDYRVYYASSVGAGALLPNGKPINIPTNWLRNEADTLVLRAANGDVLDRLVYASTTYGDASKANGGWSLERVDATYPCIAPGAWRASVAGTGGTPGAANSVAGTFFSNDTLKLGRWLLPAPNRLVLPWNQPLDSLSAADAGRYQVVAANPVGIASVQVSAWPHQQVVLQLAAPLDTNQQVVLRVTGLKRCDGSTLPESRHLLFASPVVPIALGAVTIDEAMWEPPSGGSRWLELWNRTGQAINLRGARILRTEGAATSSFDSVRLDGVVLPPFARVAVSADTLWVRTQHRPPDSARLTLLPRRLPALDASGGIWRLVGPNAQEVDRATIRRSDHQTSLRSTAGVSLQRTASGWRSSGSPTYGTPGYAPAETREVFGFRLVHEHLSPNGDNYRDELLIEYALDAPGAQAHLRIYGRGGELVAEPAGNLLLDQSGMLTWDGHDRSGRIPSAGVYVLVVEVWRPGQAVQYHRLPFALSMPF